MVRDQKKVVWFEGMTLDPHHFQQWSRYQQGVLNARIRAVSLDSWGLTRVRLDEERLANGELAVLSCAGVMPDGLVFDVPEESPPPDPRGVQDYFPATDERLRVFLAIPAERQSGRNVLLQGATNRRETRYVAESLSVSDENTGADDRPVEVARTNVQLRFAGEPLEGYSTLPITEIRRVGGGFALNEQFIPPSLYLDASARLLNVARQVLELLVAKSTELTDRRKNTASQRELSPGDVMAIELLGTVNTYIPLLNNHHARGTHHPERLFQTLLALAGQLATYVSDAPVHPRDLPAYDHAEPSASFNRIETVLRAMLGEATPSSNYERLGLERTRENLYTAPAAKTLLERAQLFLVTRSDRFTEEELTTKLPNMLRIASPNTIDAVLQSYTKALAIESTRRLPAGMPIDARASYFRLQKRGPFWESVLEEEGVAVFVPSEFADMELDLIAVG